MTDLIILFFKNFIELSNAMAPYIIFGVLIAGVLKQLIPDEFVSKHLGKGDISSVFKASLFGIPLPLCSCSVIPFATSLKKEGASKGAVQSFLISTPITGADSILATYGFFGWIFTIYRVLSSLIIAIVAGIIQNIQNSKFEEKNNETENCTSSCACSHSHIKEKKTFSLKAVFAYAFITIFKDFAKPLFWGLILGSAFSTFFPTEYAKILFENQFLTYFVILLLSMPLYICATASLPIAAGLMMSGMSGGAAFIFLSAGPATNSVTMSVVYKTLGKNSLIIYLSVIATLSLLFGYFYDMLFPNLNILNITQHSESIDLLSYIASAIMLFLIAYYIIKPHLEDSSKKNIN